MRILCPLTIFFKDLFVCVPACEGQKGSLDRLELELQVCETQCGYWDPNHVGTRVPTQIL